MINASRDLETKSKGNGCLQILSETLFSPTSLPGILVPQGYLQWAPVLDGNLRNWSALLMCTRSWKLTFQQKRRILQIDLCQSRQAVGSWFLQERTPLRHCLYYCSFFEKKKIIMYFFLHNAKQRSTYKSWVAFLAVTSMTKFFFFKSFTNSLICAQDAYSWIANSKF